MSIIDYGDYLFSEEENDLLDAENPQFSQTEGYDSQEDDYERLSNHVSDDDEEQDEQDQDHGADTDDYASFMTDYEKYQYDELRWNGIANQRKHSITKKKSKVKDGDQKKDKPKAPPKSRKKDKKKAEETFEPAVEIHFDNEGNLWYTHKNNGVYISERAVFHHWIRADLSRSKNAQGSYAFPRQRGLGSFDITCYNAVQQHWGLERANYAPVMFEWERLDRNDPAYLVGHLYYKGFLVIDYWRQPVRGFREIPMVISSAFEGGYMEPATRLHSEMAYEDIRARMPPFVEVTRKGATHYKALSKASTLSGRSRHFRERAGAITWDKREGSANIKAFIENIAKPVNNSTRGSRDLTTDEINRLKMMNHGTKPRRAKPGTTQKSKEKYIADTRKAAGLTLATISAQSVDRENSDKQELEAEQEKSTLAGGDDCQELLDEGGRMDYTEDHDNLYEDQSDQSPDDPMPSIEDSSDQENETTVAAVIDATPPRFVFCCTGALFLQAMTEGQALMHPLVDNSDSRNYVPKYSVEVDAIRDALQVTIDHFKDIFGFEPIVYEGSNYISEYCNIQDQMDEFFPDDATALRRLARWEGTLFDWHLAEVVEDPCFGRRQPF